MNEGRERVVTGLNLSQWSVAIYPMKAGDSFLGYILGGVVDDAGVAWVLTYDPNRSGHEADWFTLTGLKLLTKDEFQRWLDVQPSEDETPFGE